MNLEERLKRSETALAEIKATIRAKKSSKASVDIDRKGCAQIALGNGEDPEVAYCTMEDVSNIVSYLNSRIDWLREDLNYYREQFHEHTEHHLPEIIGAGAMERALKALGLSDDYKVEKQTIYANDGTVSAVNFKVSK